ncbi:MAG: protein kinase, partial [Candidatus Schekmanbacteria bacterium]|nr:protein kinase [Candidatus Schekmanbacteria bacterium]
MSGISYDSPVRALPATIGEYPVVRFLGEGGMGRVYLVSDPHSGADCALKWLHRTEPRHALRFRREFNTLARLRHPGVIQVGGWGIMDQRPFFTMEYVEGVDLRVAAGGPRGGDARPDAAAIGRAVSLVRRLLEPLAYIHGQGVVHRDLKPANVWVRRGDRICLMDFGLGLDVAAQTRITTSGFTMGTPAYMSPEQALGERVDYRADLYAVGVLLYELVAGELPFRGETAIQVAIKHVHETPTAPRVRNALVSAELSDLIVRLLAKDPSRRPADCAAVLAVLGEAVPGTAATVPEWGAAGPAADTVAMPAVERRGRPRAADQEAPEAEAAHGEHRAPATTAAQATQEAQAAPEAAGAAAAPMPLAFVQARLVGREAELELLEGLVDRLEGGGSGVLFLCGEAGCGKTRLLREMRKSAQFRAIRVEETAASAVDASPLGLFRGILATLAADVRRQCGRAPAERKAGPWRRLVPILARTDRHFAGLAREWRLAPAAELAGEQERMRLLDSVQEALVAMSRWRPLLLVLDDLQWADELSLEALAGIAGAILGGGAAGGADGGSAQAEATRPPWPAEALQERSPVLPESPTWAPASCAESASRRPPISPSPANGGRDGEGRCRVDGKQAVDSALAVAGAFRTDSMAAARPLGRLLAALPARVVHRVSLLGAGETAAMLQSMVPRATLAEDLLRRIHAASGGNPFFADELLRAAIQRPAAGDGAAAVAGDGGAPAAAAEPGEPLSGDDAATQHLPLPVAVRRTLLARLHGLDAGVRQLLTLAAPIGNVWEVELVLALADRSEDEVLADLDRAMQAGVVCEVSGTRAEVLSFRHDKLREVVLDELRPGTLRRLHARIGEVLDSWISSPTVSERTTGRAEELVYRAAHHFEQAGDAARALDYLCQSSRLALSAGATPLALGYTRRALAVLPDTAPRARRAALLGELLGLLSRGAHYEEAWNVANDLLTAAVLTGDALVIARAHHARANLALRAGRHQRSVEELLKGLQALRQRMPSDAAGLVLTIAALWVTRLVPFAYYRFRNRRWGGRGAGAAARRAGQERAEALYELYEELSQNYLFVLMRNHRLFFGLAVLRKSYLAERLGQPEPLMKTYGSLALAFTIFSRPRLGAAMRYLDRAARLAQRLARPLDEARTRLQAAFAYLLVSDFTASLQASGEAHEAFVAHGDVYWSLLAVWSKGQALYFLGELDSAEATIRSLIGQSERAGDRSRTSLGLGSLALIHGARGDHDRASACVREARRQGEEYTQWGLEPILRRAHARSLAAGGRLEEAIAVLRDAVEGFPPIVVGAFMAGLIRADLADLLLATLRPEAAPPWLRAAGAAPRRFSTTAGSDRGERRRRAEGGTPFDEIELYRILVEMKHFGKAVPLVAGLGWRLRARDLAARDRFRAARRAFEKASGLIKRPGRTWSTRSSCCASAEVKLPRRSCCSTARPFFADSACARVSMPHTSSSGGCEHGRGGARSPRSAGWHPCAWPTGAPGAWCRDPLLAVGLQEIQAAPQLLDHAIALGKLGVLVAQLGVLAAQLGVLVGERFQQLSSCRQQLFPSKHAQVAIPQTQLHSELRASQPAGPETL